MNVRPVLLVIACFASAAGGAEPPSTGNAAQHAVSADQPRIFPAKLLGRYEFPSRSRVTSVALIPRKHLVVAGDEAGSILLWNTESQQLVTTSKPGEGHHIAVVASSPDGEMLAVGAGSSLFLLNSATLALLRSATGLAVGEIQAATFSADGKRLLVGGHELQVLLIDVETLKELARKSIVTEAIRGLAFSANGKFAFISGAVSTDRQRPPLAHAIRWNLESDAVDFQIDLPCRSNVSRLWELPGEGLASAGPDQFHFWNAETQEELGQFQMPVGFKVDTSQDGARLAFADHQGRVWAYDFTRPEKLLGTFRTEIAIESIDLSATGAELLLGSRNGEVQHWGMDFPRETVPLSPLSETEAKLLDSPVERVVGPDELGTVKLTGHRDTILALTILPDGKHAITTGFDGRVLRWDLEKRRIVARYDGQPNAANLYFGMAADPHGKWLFLSGGQYGNTGSLALWSADHLGPVQTFSGISESCTHVAVSADGKLCAATSYQHDLVVWDTESGEEKLRIEYKNGARFFCVEFALDGEHLLAGVENHVSVYSLATGELVRTKHVGQPQVIRARPGAKEVVVDNGRNALFLTVPALEEVRRFDIDGHLNCASFSADGARLAMAGYDTVYFWEVADETLVWKRSFPSPSVSGVALTPDGQHVAIANGTSLEVSPTSPSRSIPD